MSLHYILHREMLLFYRHPRKGALLSNSLSALTNVGLSRLIHSNENTTRRFEVDSGVLDRPEVFNFYLFKFHSYISSRLSRVRTPIISIN